MTLMVGLYFIGTGLFVMCVSALVTYVQTVYRTYYTYGITKNDWLIIGTLMVLVLALGSFVVHAILSQIN